MRRVLIAWELGAQLGHVLRILVVARELRARGAEVLVAVRDLRAAADTLGRDGFTCVQAPLVHASSSNAVPGYAGLLAACGFGDPKTLRSLMLGWRGLIDCFEPDVLLADHAPSALLAARLNALPAAQLATGFELPPRIRPLPVLREWIPHTTAELLAQEESMLASVNALCHENARPPLECLADLYATAAPLLATLPELDHFAERGKAHYIGPLFALDEGVAAEWSAGAGARIFVYLRPGANAESVLEAFARRADVGINEQVIAAVPGKDEAAAARLRGPRLAVHTGSVRASVALDADLVVSNCGHGLTAAALLAGVPLLALPGHVEQWMLARRVQQLGAGMFLNPRQVQSRIGAAIDTMLSNSAYQEAARAFAGRYAGLAQGDIVRQIVDEVQRVSR